MTRTVFCMLALGTLAKGQENFTRPDWLLPIGGEKAVEESASPGLFRLSYETGAAPVVVLGKYEDLFRGRAMRVLEGSINGNAAISASLNGTLCDTIIYTTAGGSKVSIKCIEGELPAPPKAVPQISSPLRNPYNTTHHVEYSINGSAKLARITIRNNVGGTEQHEVDVPFHYYFDASSGTFVYISAQKSGADGELHVAITVDGRNLQDAYASTPYGVASASGAVPK